MDFQSLIKEHGDLTVKQFVEKVGEKTAADELKKATQKVSVEADDLDEMIKEL